MGELRKDLKRGIFWTAIDKYSGQIIAIGISMVLARLLTPYDYGVVATATIFINFISIFTSIGIGPALIQRKDLSKSDLNSIFSFTIIIGVIFGSITFACSRIIADYYENPELVPVIRLLSLSVFLGAVNMVPSALMSKNLRFREMATRSLIFQVIFGVIGVGAAFYGAGVYALICPPILSLICTFFYNNQFYPVKPTIRLSLAPIIKIFSFSSYLFLFELINYFSRNIDKIIIGKYMSANALGYYEKSYRLMQLPLQNITSVVYPVLQPVMSSLQDNLAEMASKYARIIGYFSLIGFPLAVMLHFCAEEIILIMFGAQWYDAIPAFKILALSVPFMLIINPTGPIFLSCNAPKSLFYTGLFNTSVTVAGFLTAIMVNKSIETIAWAWTITLLINTSNSYYSLYIRVMHTSILPILKGLIHPIICALIIAVVIWICSKYMLGWHLFVKLIAKTTTSLSVSIAYYWIMGIVDPRQMLSRVRMK